MMQPIANLGQRMLIGLEGFGRFWRFSYSALYWALFGAKGASRVGLVLPQFYAIGTRSIPVVALVGAFVGMVLGVEAYDQFLAVGQETKLGVVINLAVVKQIGPVLAAVMIAGRVGGAVTAELGTMRVTEQLDAMRVMGADPVAHLVVPRVLACMVMVPVLTIFSDLMGVWGGYVVSVKGFGIDSGEYWKQSAMIIYPWDVINGLCKALVFGLTIGLISCYKGFHCEAGASGVGRAATDSFVTSFIAIIMLNLFMAKVLKDFYYMVFGYGGPTVF